MTPFESHFRIFRSFRPFALAVVVLYAFSCASSAFAQRQATSASSTNGETDAAQSMGVGMQSRFASGAEPIEIQRTKIIPGTPMSVNSTMGNILTSNSNSGSFGGILARYDVSNFGKFFGTGEIPQRVVSQRIQELEALETGDNTVENVEPDRMYPPRLVLDFNEFPTHSLTSTSARANMTAQIENAIGRFKFDRSIESVRVELRGGTIILRGAVKSQRLSNLIANVLSMQPGVEAVDNQLVVLTPDSGKVDVYGLPLTTER